MEYILIT